MQRSRTPLRAHAACLARAGLACGIVDGIWAVVLTLAYGRPVLGLFQGIAATPFGPRMLELGLPSTLLGLAMHFSVAFWWSGVFLAASAASPWLRRALATTRGRLGLAAVYGPAIWIVMSLAVVPLLSGRPAALTWRWWIQIAGHVAFVGAPIVWSVGRCQADPPSPAS